MFGNTASIVRHWRFAAVAALVAGAAFGGGRTATIVRAQEAPAKPAPAKDGKGPRVQVSVDAIDFGKIKPGKTCSREIVITSSGDAPLAVTRIGVHCECARLHLSTARRPNVPIAQDDEGRVDLVLEPGEIATLGLSIDTSKLANGLFEKRCLIVCSDPANGNLSIPFKVDVDKPAADALPKKEEDKKGDGKNGVDAVDPNRPAPAQATDGTVPAGGPPDALPRIEADSYKADFGVVYRGEKLFHSFKIKNSGQADLVLSEVKNSCSCAASKVTIGDKVWSEEQLRDAHGLGALKPGEEATIDVELRTSKATLPGKDMKLTKALRVYSNDNSRNPLTLLLDATMISPFTLEPEEFNFGRLHKGESKSLTTILYSDQLGNFDITGAKSPNPELVKVEAKRLPADGNRPPTWEITATVEKSAPLGNYSNHVELSVDHPRVKEISIPLYLSVEPNITFTGTKSNDGRPFLDFGKLAGDADKTLELTIENGDPTVPYLPQTVSVEAKPRADLFKVELVEVEKGMRYVVKLTVPAELKATRFFQGDLVITSDHPDVPVMKVRFRGFYEKDAKQ